MKVTESRIISRRCLLGSAAALSVAARSLAAEDHPPPFVPTPMPIVRQMLQFGGLKRNEYLFDAGSGDGRIVIAAAKEFGAESVGVEYNHELVVESRNRIRQAGIEKRARIIEGDLFAQDYSRADVVTVYLLPATNRRLRPLLERQLKTGARVVANDFPMEGWEPDTTLNVEDDGSGQSRTLFLYRR